jgi:predicted membrane protein
MNTESNRNSNSFLAIILIVFGGIWLLHQLGVYFDFPHFSDFIFPFRSLFREFGHTVFSFPVILIIIGLILLAGRHTTSGTVLIVIGGLFLLPRIFMIPGFSIALILPVILIGIGVALIAKIL